MSMKTLALLLVVLFLAGCSGITTTRYTLVPAPNECQANEIRISMLSTLSAAVCWDADTRPIGLTGGAGKAAISVPLEILGAAASVAGPVIGATILGGALVKASHATVKGSVTTSGNVTTSGSVSGTLTVPTITVPPVSVLPVSIVPVAP